MKLRGPALGILLALVPVAVIAVDVLITALVQDTSPPLPPDTAVIFRGIAYPNSPVTIQRNGVAQVVVPADPAARFDVKLSNQAPGPVTYTVFASDALGLVGSPMDFSLQLTLGSTVTLSGIFLGPTIQADKDRLRLGDTVTLLGVTAPQSEVTIIVASEQDRMFTTTADASGAWVRQIVAQDIGIGDHTARAKAVSPQQAVSSFSKSVAFSVVAGPAGPCDGRNRADINCDGRVNLTDFSILLFYWRQREPANARADMNRDGTVNLTDFSILLFNWSR